MHSKPREKQREFTNPARCHHKAFNQGVPLLEKSSKLCVYKMIPECLKKWTCNETFNKKTNLWPQFLTLDDRLMRHRVGLNKFNDHLARWFMPLCKVLYYISSFPSYQLNKAAMDDFCLWSPLKMHWKMIQYLKESTYSMTLMEFPNFFQFHPNFGSH